MSSSFKNLNSRQREAVEHGDGPLLVLAGAGSGKTSMMAHRIAHLLGARKFAPEAVLGLSFTNKAARELKERVHKLVGGRTAPRGLWITTFHSLGVRFLRKHAALLGFTPDFSILDESDQVEAIKGALKNLRIDDRRFDVDVIRFEISRAKNQLVGLSGSGPQRREAFVEQAQQYFLESRKLSEDYALATASVLPAYQAQLRALNAMDFDDLLYHSVHLLRDFAPVRDEYNRRFAHILVDEYQDTNSTQFTLLKHLLERRQNLCVVGDDDQSIYGWRGADPTHILEFTKHFPTARVITLDQNYRSNKTILDAANRVIEGNTHRHAKKLWSDRGEGPLIDWVTLEDDRHEAEEVAQRILERAKAENRPYKDFAVLYRSNAQSRVFEEALRRHRIPYKIVGGMSFLDRKEVRDALAYLRVLVNPLEDQALRRIINWPARGIGKATLEAAGNHAFARQISLFEALSELRSLSPPPTEKAIGAAVAFRDLVLELRRDLGQLPGDPAQVALFVKRTLERLGVKRALTEETEDPAALARQQENVEEIVHGIGQLRTEDLEATPEDLQAGVYSGQSLLQDYLSRLMLESKTDREPGAGRDASGAPYPPRDEMTLLTLHGSKGLEFPIVILVGIEEGLLPHRRSIEGDGDLAEERRLCYVGITRAKDHLTLTRARNRVRFGKQVPRIASRFALEIPEALLNKQNLSQGPDLDTPQEQEAHETRVKNFLAEIRGRIQAGPTS